MRKASLDAGRNETWVRDLLHGRTQMPSAEHLEKLAEVLDSSPQWLLHGGEHSGNVGGRTVPLVGHVGAGAEILIIDDHAKGAGLEEVAAPPGAPRSTIAVRVRGESQLGRFDDGDIIFYSEHLPPDDLVNRRECVVKLADGRLFVKRLVRGSGQGLYTLLSSNAAPIDDVAVEWAAKIDAVSLAY